RVLAARLRPQRPEVANTRRPDGEVDLPRTRIGQRLDRPALDAAGPPVDGLRSFVLFAGLGAGTDLGAVTLAREQDDRGRSGRGNDGRDDQRPPDHRRLVGPDMS